MIGSDLLELYDEEGNLVTEPNKVGEVYSRSPMLLSGYWKEPEKLAAAMKGEYFSAGDMGYKDEEGYLFLVDRKANMIISGGENIFPSEVENVVGGYPKVKDVAVIGIPHEKWGETSPRRRRPPRGADRHPRGDHELLQGQDRRVQGAEERRLHQG